jgi:adenine-specific DNA-methyltransferase
MTKDNAMQKLGPDDPLTRSLDLVAGNIAQLKALFPELVTEGVNGAAVNADALKALVGDASVTEADEKYGLNWHGKRRARQLALAPSTGTLRPSSEDSVDWDTTLKLLQKSYAGKVKLIYIDPPYNTGEDFVYPDEFKDSIANYQRLMGWRDVEGEKVSSLARNSESSGRFHTDWLNMMYPRLHAARLMLRKDGVVLISIDDTEAANLRLVCDNVFGSENFVAQIVWEGANKNDARQIGVCHEYVLAYAHTRTMLPSEWSLAKEGVDAVLTEVERLKAKYKDDYDTASQELAGWFRAVKAKPAFAHRRFRHIDERGAYKEDDPTAPGGRRFELRHPHTGKIIPLRRNRGWGFDQLEFERLVSEGRISFVTDTSIMVRRYLHETDKMTPQSVFYQPARSASERLARLMGANVFDFPKDEIILQKFVEMATDPADTDCIVMDFFAGSGTTAEAVMAQNATDGGARRYVLVQLPEPLSPDREEQKVAAAYCDKLDKPQNIAELTKERLRRAAKKIKDENAMFSGDIGFRVFKLASSNIRAWEPDRDHLAKTLEDAVEHLKSDRTEQDVLYELLLKLGLDLCVPIESKTIAGKTVHSIGSGVLIACLADKIARKEAEALGLGIVDWRKALAPAGDTTCVFRDNAFVDDVAKTNLAAILQQNGLENVRSI